MGSVLLKIERKSERLMDPAQHIVDAVVPSMNRSRLRDRFNASTFQRFNGGISRHGTSLTPSYES
jgi:hypothetical protein